MLAGITITCFAASYLVALLLEASRLWFRSSVRGAVMIGFAAAGVLAQTLYLAHRAAEATGTPLSSPFDWYLIAAWVLAVSYLYLTLYHPGTAFGLFMLPLVLGLVAVGSRFADRAALPEPQAVRIWGLIHGGFLLLGIVAVVIGFVGGAMCLVQSHRLKHKLPPLQGLRLPSLEWLERLNARAIVISVVMLGIGFLSGIVLNLVNRRLDLNNLPWNDPIIWSSGVLLAWLVAAAGFSALYKPARQGRKVAYLTVGSFLFLVLFIGVQLLLPSAHGSSGREEGSKSRKVENPQGTMEGIFTAEVAEGRRELAKHWEDGKFEIADLSRFEISDLKYQSAPRPRRPSATLRLFGSSTLRPSPPAGGES